LGVRVPKTVGARWLVAVGAVVGAVVGAAAVVHATSHERPGGRPQSDRLVGPIVSEAVKGRWRTAPPAIASGSYIATPSSHGSPDSLQSFGFGEDGSLSALYQIGATASIGLNGYSLSGRQTFETRLSNLISTDCQPRFAGASSELVSCASSRPFTYGIGHRGAVMWSDLLRGTSNLYFNVTSLDTSP
jgi:hypothetical protein